MEKSMEKEGGRLVTRYRMPFIAVFCLLGKIMEHLSRTRQNVKKFYGIWLPCSAFSSVAVSFPFCSPPKLVSKDIFC